MISEVEKINFVIINNGTVSPLVTTFARPFKEEWRRSSLRGRKDGVYGTLMPEEWNREGSNAGQGQQEDRKGKTQNRERISGVSRP